MKNVPQHQAQSLPIGDKINKPIDFEIVKCASGGNFSNCLVLLHALLFRLFSSWCIYGGGSGFCGDAGNCHDYGNVGEEGM